ncbi:MAG: hypothetical protein IKG18_11120 [Atopobiaceae bacterium]|nr:hypothetical protein [Atopobiaceae bacterium]
MDLTPMHREDEVLAFDLDLATGNISNVHPLDRADLAPLGVLDDEGVSDWALAQFVRRRSLSRFREDLPLILEALAASHPCELVVRTHGFSLSDQFWYRANGDTTTWAGSNFFDNGWDDASGDAIIARDYDALAHADSFVPDLACGGGTRKAWLHTPDGSRLLKASYGGECEPVGEVLGARMLSRILDVGEYVPYELVSIGGETYSSCPPVVNRDEDLLTPPTILSVSARSQASIPPPAPGDWVGGVEELLESMGVANPRRAIAKAAVAESLLFKKDFHSGNYGFVRNAAGRNAAGHDAAGHDATGRNATADIARPAPFFDFAGSFGTFGMQLSHGAHRHRLMVGIRVATWYSNLEPSWDYSWLDPTALDGFGEELEKGLAACRGLPSEYPAIAHELFDMQLDYVCSVVRGGASAEGLAGESAGGLAGESTGRSAGGPSHSDLPRGQRVYLHVDPASVDACGQSSEPIVTTMDAAAQDEFIALADRLLAASSPTELVLVWCGDEPLYAPSVIRNITRPLRTVTAEHGAGLRAVVVTDGRLLNERMQEMLADSRVKRVCVMIDGLGETFDQVMENLSRPCRLAVEVCMKVNARSPEEVVLVRERVSVVAQKSGNSLEFVEADAFDGRGDELSVDDAMTPQVIGQIAAPIFKKWGVARAWVFGSFASGWAHALRHRSDGGPAAGSPPWVSLLRLPPRAEGGVRPEGRAAPAAVQAGGQSVPERDGANQGAHLRGRIARGWPARRPVGWLERERIARG